MFACATPGHFLAWTMCDPDRAGVVVTEDEALMGGGGHIAERTVLERGYLGSRCGDRPSRLERGLGRGNCDKEWRLHCGFHRWEQR